MTKNEGCGSLFLPTHTWNHKHTHTHRVWQGWLFCLLAPWNTQNVSETLDLFKRLSVTRMMGGSWLPVRVRQDGVCEAFMFMCVFVMTQQALGLVWSGRFFWGQGEKEAEGLFPSFAALSLPYGSSLIGVDKSSVWVGLQLQVRLCLLGLWDFSCRTEG